MKIGVVLSGCGFLDGAEIHESVLALLAIDRAGHEAICLAPDRKQADVVNHLTNKPSAETRNVLAESARIARGKIKDVARATAKDLDALVLPGGYGAAKNISNFASAGPGCEVIPEVNRLVREMHAAGKPIGAICIAPACVARALGDEGPTVTIGNDRGTAAAIQRMGAKHKNAPVTEAVTDEKNRIVTTPAYMLAHRISEAAEGIEKLVAEVVRLAQTKPAAVK